MDSPEQLAQSLLGVAALAVSLSDSPEPQGEGEWKPLPGIVQDEPAICGSALKLVSGLQLALDDADWNAPPLVCERFAGYDWTFGTARTIRRPIRIIKGGFLEPVLRVPLVTRIPEKVVLYLITLDGGEDYLDRETHGMGWHYHYLDRNKQRTDVMLSWDTRWTEAPSSGASSGSRGIFAERHGDGRIHARPRRWGPRKRQTMYDACAPDLARWPISEFRCAADKSELVHPPAAVLTPR